MVTFEELKLLISSVFLMDFLGVMRSYEIILLATEEHGWNEARVDISNRIYLENIEIGFLYDRISNHFHGQ